MRDGILDVPMTAVNGYVEFSCSDDWEWNRQLTKIETVLKVCRQVFMVCMFMIFHLEVQTVRAMTTCASHGGHWNPEGTDHGTNLVYQRQIGDMANIEPGENGVAEGTFEHTFL
jgi:hypothetical protein